MSFIGNVPAEAYSPVAKDTFSGDNSTTDFTLSIPATTNGVEVLVENVQQEPTTAYTISGTTLSFTAAPVTGTNNIYVIHRGPAVQTIVPPAGVAIDASTITGTGDMNIDSGTLFVDASANRVGIGTSSPDYKVEIAGYSNASSDNKLAIGDIADYQGLIHMESATETLTIENTSDYSLRAIIFKHNATEVGRFDADANLRFNSGYGSAATAYGCRAWVNFEGVNPVNIRGSGNISTVGYSATGSYQVNFTTAMPDATYAAPTGVGGNNGVTDLSSKSTTHCNFFTRDLSGNQQDQATVDIAIFR